LKFKVTLKTTVLQNFFEFLLTDAGVKKDSRWLFWKNPLKNGLSLNTITETQFSFAEEQPYRDGLMQELNCIP